MAQTTYRYILWAAIIGNIGFALYNYGLLIMLKRQKLIFNNDNYPFELPTHFDAVGMTLLRDTSHFQMDLGNISHSEWNTLSFHPFVVHLGTDQRAFQVALFHELHCVHVMEQTFLYGEYHRLNEHHLQHCENYLRQSFLCAADDSMESGDFVEEVNKADRNMGSKVCRDWMGVSATVMKNLNDWLAANSHQSVDS